MNLAPTVAAFDDAVDSLCASVRNPQLDRFMYRLSSAADHSLLWHACGVARAAVRGDPAGALRFSAAMGIESGITNGLVKALFGRGRPQDYASLTFSHGLRRPITTSFPSGHAAAAFCAGRLLGGGPWYLVATVVATTRVYVRLHYASDVIGGAVLGLALGTLMRPLVNGRE